MHRLIIPGLFIIALTGIIYKATQPAMGPTSPVIVGSDSTLTTDPARKVTTGMISIYGEDGQDFRPCDLTEQDTAKIVFIDQELANKAREQYSTITENRIPGTPVKAEVVMEYADAEANAYVDLAPVAIVHEIVSLSATGSCMDEEIRVSNPIAGSTTSFPIQIQGEARGTWLFEGTMQAIITDNNGLIIGETILEAQSEWMTEDFVPFAGEVSFEEPVTAPLGHVIIQSANPSGLPENDKAYEFRIIFPSPDATSEE